MNERYKEAKFLLEQARLDDHIVALLLLLLQKNVITGPEYEAALHTALSARMLSELEPGAGTNPTKPA